MINTEAILRKENFELVSSLPFSWKSMFEVVQKSLNFIDIVRQSLKIAPNQIIFDSDVWINQNLKFEKIFDSILLKG